MTLSFSLLGFAAVALVAFLCSAAIASILWIARGLGGRLSASARARLLLCAAMLPAIASSAVVIAAIGAATGLFDDHCALGGGGHAHAHLCLSHPPIGLPSVPLLLAGAFLAMRLGLAVARLTRDLVLASRMKRRLDAQTAGSVFGAHVVPWDAPNAFVLGVVTPRVYVTRGLFAEGSREHVEPVLAHERAHVRRRDALRRALARVALAFHLPGAAGPIERALSRAQEMAADAAAAVVVGSGERVARALVHVARASRRAPLLAVSFGPTEVEARVRDLLDDRERLEWPSPAVLVCSALVAIALLLVGAESLHHGIEHMVVRLGA